ncbi:MAG: Fis family transcriptional regulator [Subtercola sp.]|nr:Fis family transcriptional regulator [Subtercola sp.]
MKPTVSVDVRDGLFELIESRRQPLASSGIELSSSVLDSWQRSLGLGLRPVGGHPYRASRDADEDGRLARLAGRVAAASAAELDRSAGCLSLTDPDGIIIRQWAGDGQLLTRLHESSLLPGFCAAESAIGTTSAMTLVSRRPAIVRGPEHFSELFTDITSSGMVIRHPVTRAVLGSLHLTNSFLQTSAIALNWVTELVRSIENEFLEEASEIERIILARYMRENRDSRHAVIALNEQTIMMNAAAARLFDRVDQATLWESASKVKYGRSPTVTTVSRPDGSTFTWQCSPIDDDGRTVGVLIRMPRPMTRKPEGPRRVIGLPGLEGTSPRWREMEREIRAAAGRSIILTGEAGVGKSTVARSINAGGLCRVVETGTLGTLSVRDWFYGSTPDWSSSRRIILKHLERLSSEAAESLARILEEEAPDLRIVGTFTGEESAIPASLRAHFVAAVRVPSISDRLPDLSALVSVLSARWLKRFNDPRSEVVWSPDALRALSRLDWPANVHSLNYFVGRVLSLTDSSRVDTAELPPEVVSLAARRALVGLEKAEAEAILRAVRDQSGNMVRAAESLGIARSTLYRKVRALGLDFDASNF